MRLSPLSFNLNNQIRNSKIQNQPKLRPMASDSISFSAKIPANFRAESKYQKLLQVDEKGEMTYLAESKDREVLKLLKQMKDDDTVSDEFKINLLSKQCGMPFKTRVKLGRKERDYHFKVALAMLDLMPEGYKGRLLTTDALRKASPEMAKVLLSSHQEQQLLSGRWGYNTVRHEYEEPFVEADPKKRQAILACCDESLQRQLLVDRYLVYHRPLHEILDLAPNDQIKKDIFQVLTEYSENNILHGIDSDKLEYCLNRCGLKDFPDVLAKLLLQTNKKHYFPIETVGSIAAQMMLDAVPDEKTRNAIFGRIAYDGQTIVHRCTSEAIPVIIANAPDDESKKSFLTTKYQDKLPIERASVAGKIALIKLSPDD